SLVLQKLSAKTRSGRGSDTRGASSTNPACFFRIGNTLLLMMVVSSLALPDLVFSSTTLVYMGSTPFGGKNVKGTSRKLAQLPSLPARNGNTIRRFFFSVNCQNFHCQNFHCRSRRRG